MKRGSTFTTLFFMILWRYLLYSYLRVFFLSVFSFIALLLVSRFKEIARFAALSCNGWTTAWFTVCQLSLVLPIAIPISSLIAALLLFQRMHRSHELIALRAAGLSLWAIARPILWAAAICACINFWMAGHFAPMCRREAQQLLCTETTDNPLQLLQRQQLLKIRHAYLRMDLDAAGFRAENFFLIAYNSRNKRLNLINARELEVQKEALIGRDVAVISHLPANEGIFDSLVVENQEVMSTKAMQFAQSLNKHRFRVEPTFLSLSMLRMRLLDGDKHAKKAGAELFRRIAWGLAPFTLAMLGWAFGRYLFIALLCSTGVLMSFLLGKELWRNPIAAAAVFFLPQIFAWILSARRLAR